MKNFYYLSIGATLGHDCKIWSYGCIAGSRDEVLLLALKQAQKVYPDHIYSFPDPECIEPVSYEDLEQIVKEVYEPMKAEMEETAHE